MKRYIQNFPFAFLLVFLGAILLRIILINWTLNFGNNLDFSRYEDWARIAHVYSFADTYTTKHLSVSVFYPNNQPPGSLYILSGSYETYIFIGKLIAKLSHTSAGSLTWVNTYLQHIIMKTTFLISDILIGLLAFALVLEKGKKRALLAAALVLFNPIVWYNSAIWGQMDSLNNMFFLLALFFAFQNKYILSILAYATSLYIKLSLLPLLPFYFVFLFFLSKKQIKPLLLGIVVSSIAVILATFPISHNPVQWLAMEIPIIAHGELQNITVAAFNFWWAVTCFPTICTNNLPVLSDKFLGITLNIWGYVIFAITTVPLLILQIKKPKIFTDKQHIFLLLSLVALSIFLFLPNMHDRYMYPVFPLLAVSAALAKRMKVFLILYGILTALHVSNLIYSWYPTYFPVFVIYQILYNNLFRWSISVLTLLTFLWLYRKSFFIFLAKQKKEI